MANIEAGYIWNGHESLAHVTYIPTSGGAAGQFDRHATWVGMIMGGRPAGARSGRLPTGHGAQMPNSTPARSPPVGQAALRYPRSRLRFYLDFNGISTFGPYRAAFITGVPASAGSRPADVINSSWVGGTGSSELAGNDNLSGTLDALICANPTNAPHLGRRQHRAAAASAQTSFPSPASATTTSPLPPSDRAAAPTI